LDLNVVGTEKFVKGQGAIEYKIILAVVLFIVAGAIFYLSFTRGPPPLGAFITSKDNTILLKVTVVGPRIAAVDWWYSVSTMEGNRNWEGGVQPIGDVVEDIELENRPPGTYYVSIKHVPTGHEWISDKAVTI
jgi:hypothetical protein